MTGIIILAAGSSSRMGQPKQQLVFEERTLIQRAIQSAVSSIASRVVVVLGAKEELIKPHIANEQVQFVFNADWQQGMSTSIAAGIRVLLNESVKTEGAILMLCDQPFVSESVLNQLIQVKAEKAAAIVACTYQDTIGAPVLFDQRYFDELLTLKGQEGAKKLLYKYEDQVIAIPFPKGSIDIDTPDDYENLKDL
ncbi:nucleotidyltransferase family protein [Mucilaginibacter lacusdianchii]|uniref:nucleotidyltransferase family protein n=1 Tax=Mucilaginibacter lacusdianchii TaxID=2684211 RepID=UPI00131E2833|nr:nucleotidyltransferase family protein [Mucilaginibacter sp. JXJ CY 39]